MIKISPAAALLLYLLASLLFLFFMALVRNLQAKPTLRLLPSHTLQVCEYCQFAYLHDQEISQCPRCKAFNRS